MNDLQKLNFRKSLGATVGGLRRAQMLSPERRREIAMLGVKARLEKRKKSIPSQVPERAATGQVAEEVSDSKSDGSRIPRSPEQIHVRPWSGRPT